MRYQHATLDRDQAIAEKLDALMLAANTAQPEPTAEIVPNPRANRGRQIYGGSRQPDIGTSRQRHSDTRMNRDYAWRNCPPSRRPCAASALSRRCSASTAASTSC